MVPAAGRASRLGRLPCSKEIFPVGLGDACIRPAIAHLLEAFAVAGVGHALVLLRQGKWDVPAFLGETYDCNVQEDAAQGGEVNAVELAYRVLEPTASVPETLARALPFVQNENVALGFPDILFTPKGAFRSLLERLESHNADAVLGLFPADRPEKTDMVEYVQDGEVCRVQRLRIKQPDAGLTYTWSIAVWAPSFSRYLLEFLRQVDTQKVTREIYVGNVIEAAIADGLNVEAVQFPEGSYLDIGTPDDLARALASRAPIAKANP